MPSPNYRLDKRRRELDKARRQQAKRLKKAERAGPGEPGEGGPTLAGRPDP